MEQNKIYVYEIFGPTIQGEGPNVGMKCIFVRVAGCDFKCSWCDSAYAWNIDEKTKAYTSKELIETLLQKCEETKTTSVIITGGNPCLYDFSWVIEKLHENYITIDIETQGSKLPNWLYDIDQLVISPKGPSSKQPDVYNNIETFLKNESKMHSDYKVAIKIPIFNIEDMEFAQKYYELVEKIKLEFTIDIRMYLSVGNTDTNEEGDISKRVLQDYQKLIEMVNYSNMKKVYILPQVHTLVWGNRSGV